jgi:hypothetical protein
MIELVGLPLSAIALVIFFRLLLDWRRRRDHFEPVNIARFRIEPRAMKWVWLFILIGSFAAGTGGPAVAREVHGRPVLDARHGNLSEPTSFGRTVQRYRITALLPFYRINRTLTRPSDAVEIVTVAREIILPVWLIGGVVLYWLVVLQRPKIPMSNSAS